MPVIFYTKEDLLEALYLFNHLNLLKYKSFEVVSQIRENGEIVVLLRDYITRDEKGIVVSSGNVESFCLTIEQLFNLKNLLGHPDFNIRDWALLTNKLDKWEKK